MLALNMVRFDVDRMFFKTACNQISVKVSMDTIFRRHEVTSFSKLLDNIYITSFSKLLDNI